MVVIRKRGEEIRQFILNSVESYPKDVVSLTAKTFKITRQAVMKHIQRLVEQGAITASGSTRSRRYNLCSFVEFETAVPIDKNSSEDLIWRNEIEPKLGKLPDNVLSIWHYGFTEMMNNAIDHSEGRIVILKMIRTSTSTEISLYDDGVGIFRKIQNAFGLEDERHAVLELSKGKLTTDPKHHTGEGIFFSSRMFDKFAILSGTVFFSHTHEDKEEDWISEVKSSVDGTHVYMKLKNNTARTAKKIFDEFSSVDGDYRFIKTVVPVRLAQYGNEMLVSRSQAKRLLARVDKFKKIVLDFNNVEEIGQAFADEAFRVFAGQHPLMEIIPINTNEAVEQMIQRALTNKEEPDTSSNPAS